MSGVFQKVLEHWNIGTLENWVLRKHHSITPSLQYSTIPVFISPGAARFESPTRGSCLGLRIASQNPVVVERLDRAVLRCRSIQMPRKRANSRSAARPGRRGGSEDWNVWNNGTMKSWNAGRVNYWNDDQRTIPLFQHSTTLFDNSSLPMRESLSAGGNQGIMPHSNILLAMGPATRLR